MNKVYLLLNMMHSMTDTNKMSTAIDTPTITPI